MFQSLAALLSIPSLLFLHPQVNVLNTFHAKPAYHFYSRLTKFITPIGLSPSTIKSIYQLPSSSGAGKIAIIDAYSDPKLESDLNIFDTQYKLPVCKTSNGCFTIHKMAGYIAPNSGWGLEESLDVEWAHAIAPTAKVVLVEAKSDNGQDLVNAIDYARNLPGVVSVGMSWGGSEFSGVNSLDSLFTSQNKGNITFFAAAGDSGNGVEWPAVSSNVTGVGGTTLNFINNKFSSETAWLGSGGGLSLYEPEPVYQISFSVPNANSFRAVPDVSFDADPNSGVSVYDTYSYQGLSGWLQLGGTSIGAASWAAINSLENNSNSDYYRIESLYPGSFNDILTGSNGSCTFYCFAQPGYDYITGLGSPKGLL